jgi:hypothetical protein
MKEYDIVIEGEHISFESPDSAEISAPLASYDLIQCYRIPLLRGQLR